ncbi:EVE domain-containing protein [Oceaniglobus trochenteri]|uniref:EVE domain-containing protein n=1 Tax=Oceaniglobus trochenteri TaxID=2763260 RepID=UPI001D001A22|nr:EVE domain-containing protein [Oceaniglobus trochenteri]
MARHWIGVATQDHITAAVSGGFVQLGHGRHSEVAALSQGDLIAFYATRERMGAGPSVQAFTALARITSDLPVKVDQGGGFHPFRHGARFAELAEPAPIRPLLERLALTQGRGKAWGMALRRSLIGVTQDDFAVIARAMGVTPSL